MFPAFLRSQKTRGGICGFKGWYWKSTNGSPYFLPKLSEARVSWIAWTFFHYFYFQNFQLPKNNRHKLFYFSKEIQKNSYFLFQEKKNFDWPCATKYWHNFALLRQRRKLLITWKIQEFLEVEKNCEIYFACFYAYGNNNSNFLVILSRFVPDFWE